VPHVHIHILPRHPKDFEPIDAVYDHLEKVDINNDFESIRQQAKNSQAKLKMDSERHPVRDLCNALEELHSARKLTMKRIPSGLKRRWKKKPSGSLPCLIRVMYNDKN
jgi:hypothetical protein